jgi:hypothetical protein
VLCGALQSRLLLGISVNVSGAVRKMDSMARWCRLIPVQSLYQMRYRIGNFLALSGWVVAVTGSFRKQGDGTGFF